MFIMNKGNEPMSLKSILTAAAVSGFALATGHAATLIDSSSTGLYNDGIGTALNGTNPFGSTFLFPTSGDPSIPSAPEPDLSSASAALGGFLTTPAAPGGTWSATEVAIPLSWTVGTETAIIYSFTLDTAQDVTASFGVDNGLYVWLDGAYKGGTMAPGGSSLGEFELDFGTLAAGTYYLQLLREDHGGATGFDVLVEGADVDPIPLPGALPLFMAGAGLMAARLRKKS